MNNLIKSNINIFIIFTIMVFISICTSCKTVQLSDLKPESKNQQLLPFLEPIIDVNSLEASYTRSITYAGGAGTSYSKNNSGEVSVQYNTTNYFTRFDKRVQETITLFEREVKENISVAIGNQKGYITCKITASDIKATHYECIVISIITLGIPNLFGFPTHFFKTELELEVEIKDLNQNVITRYTALGMNEVPVALYWGYSADLNNAPHQAARKSNIEAFKIAMNEIKIQIQNDYSYLMSKFE